MGLCLEWLGRSCVARLYIEFMKSVLGGVELSYMHRMGVRNPCYVLCHCTRHPSAQFFVVKHVRHLLMIPLDGARLSLLEKGGNERF